MQQIGNEWANPQTLYVLPKSIVYKTYVRLSSQDVNVNNGIRLCIPFCGSSYLKHCADNKEGTRNKAQESA
jgi:hypothetical protein